MCFDEGLEPVSEVLEKPETDLGTACPSVVRVSSFLPMKVIDQEPTMNTTVPPATL
jgi:hypothetical protein